MEDRTGSPPHGTAGQPGGTPPPWRRGEPWQPWAGDQLRPWHGGPGYRFRRHGPGRWRRGPRGSGPLRRSREDRLAGGVAAGLARRTGFNVTFVRVAFIIASLASGFGVAAYVVAWLLVPAAGEDRSIGSRSLADRRGIALAAGLVSVLALVLLVAGATGVSWVSSAAWPLLIGAAGLTLIWRNGPAEDQETIRRLLQPVAGVAGGGGRAMLVLRVLVAVVLLAGGLGMLVSGHHHLATLLPLAGVGLVIAAFVILLGPWWLRIARDLVLERQARARAEERADMAARVHDSVLQTLALIQRRAGDPQQVIQLARAQERELRSWLFGGRPPGQLDGEVRTLAEGVRRIQQEVEAQHGISVETVTVGDCELDDDLAALLAAGREATVNAAKWSGAPAVSLFAEVEPGEVSLFVRDRGRGFDPQAVSPDRKGLAESIRARMARHGGTAAVRSAVGEGTEVSLAVKSATGFKLVPPGQRTAT
ncbi:MAG: PspC domain-containing protein [Gemmatimonadota bacterium]